MNDKIPPAAPEEAASEVSGAVERLDLRAIPRQVPPSKDVDLFLSRVTSAMNRAH